MRKKKQVLRRDGFVRLTETDVWSTLFDLPATFFAASNCRNSLLSSVRYWETAMKRLSVFILLWLVVFHLSPAYSQTVEINIKNAEMDSSGSTRSKIAPNAGEKHLMEPSFNGSAVDTSSNPLGLEWVWVEGGTFKMGCTAEQSNCYDNEKPVHEVYVDGFYISRYEVTVAQFAQFVKETGYKTDAEKEGYSWVLEKGKWNVKNGIDWRYNGRNEIRPKSEYNHPVIHVSWNDASAFCSWLSKKTGTAVRLPTEAEWEYAARGGRKSRGFKFAGGNNADSVAWYWYNSNGNTHSVGQKKPNELGLYDMSGNVYEWCLDWYDDSYYGKSAHKNPMGPSSGFYRVLRGGGWSSGANELRVSIRTPGRVVTTNSSYGFRLRKAR